jgi:hypothetical protein
MTSTDAARKPRRSRVPETFRIQFLIGDDTYSVIPLPADASVARKAYRLSKHGAKPASYDVRQAPEGFVECSCPGHTYRGKCKHVRALTAAGMVAAATEPQP